MDDGDSGGGDGGSGCGCGRCCHGAQQYFRLSLSLALSLFSTHIAHKFVKYFISSWWYISAIFFIGWILILIYYVWHFLFEIYTNIYICMHRYSVSMTCYTYFSMIHFHRSVLLNWICRDARWELCKSVNVTTSYIVTHTHSHIHGVFSFHKV